MIKCSNVCNVKNQTRFISTRAALSYCNMTTPSDSYTVDALWHTHGYLGYQSYKRTAESFLAGAEKKQKQKKEHITVQFYTGSYKVAALEEM